MSKSNANLLSLLVGLTERLSQYIKVSGGKLLDVFDNSFYESLVFIRSSLALEISLVKVDCRKVLDEEMPHMMRVVFVRSSGSESVV